MLRIIFSMNDSHIKNFQLDVEEISEKKLLLAKRTEEQMQEMVRRKQKLSLELKRALPASPSDQQSSYDGETASECDSSFQEATNRKYQIASALSLLPQNMPSSIDTAETFHTAAADSPELRIAFENADAMRTNNTMKIESENNEEWKENETRDDSLTQNNANLFQVEMNENLTDVSKIASRESMVVEENESKIQVVTTISENMLQDSLESPIQQNSAMKRLNQRIARQRIMVMRCLDADTPSKEDLNRQIMILQDLQKQQIELEISLLEDERKNNSSQQFSGDTEDDAAYNDDRLVVETENHVQHEPNAYCSVVESTNNSSAILLTVAQTRSQLFKNNRPNVNDQQTLSESLTLKRSSNRGYSTVYLTVSCC